MKNGMLNCIPQLESFKYSLKFRWRVIPGSHWYKIALAGAAEFNNTCISSGSSVIVYMIFIDFCMTILSSLSFEHYENMINSVKIISNECFCQHYAGMLSRHGIDMVTSSNGNISALLARCAGSSPVPGEFPSQRPVSQGLWCFLWSAPEQTVEWTLERPVIWGAIALIIMTSL